jgi:ankyrin repeat protein
MTSLHKKIEKLHGMIAKINPGHEQHVMRDIENYFSRVLNPLLNTEEKNAVLNTVYRYNHHYLEDAPGFSALGRAISKGYMPLIKFLIKQGSDINEELNGRSYYRSDFTIDTSLEFYMEKYYRNVKSNQHAMTGFILGGRRGIPPILRESINIDDIKFFVEHGAEVTPNILDMARTIDPEILLPYLTRVRDERREIGFTNQWTNLRTVEINDVYFENKDGDTSLILAAERGDLNRVNTLIEMGSDVNHRNNNGQTALHHAMVYGHESVANLLLSRGADPNILDDDKNTPKSIQGLL